MEASAIRWKANLAAAFAGVNVAKTLSGLVVSMFKVISVSWILVRIRWSVG
jgi:hypothetical protein